MCLLQEISFSLASFLDKMDRIIDLVEDSPPPVQAQSDNEEAQEPLIIYNDVSAAGGIHHEEIVESTSGGEAAAGPSTTANVSAVDDDNACSICFDSYTTSGPHRMTCLKCGHLFGKRCIEKWFQQTVKGGGNRAYGSCPTCKQKAKRTDIREHYCRGIKIVDTSERDEAVKERDREREEKKKLQIELATLRQQRETEIGRLQEELRELQQRVASGRHDMPDTSSTVRSSAFAIPDSPLRPGAFRSAVQTIQKPSNMRLEAIQKIDVCRDGEARVMDYMPSLSMLVASSKSSTHLFPGFGLTKVHTGLLRCSKFVRVHSQSIRDVKFTPSQDALILTASLDKTMKITSVHSDGLVHSWNVNQSAWSCSWKTGETHYLFAGTQNGKVKLYDSRMPLLASQGNDAADPTSVPVDTFDCGNMGIIGLHWVDLMTNINARGLLVSMIDRILFLEHVSATEFRPHVLAVENKITSTSYHKETQHFLTSFGPSARREKVEHSLKELVYRSEPQPSYSCNSTQSFNGGRQQLYMCRNSLFAHPTNNSLMALVFDEPSDKLQLWDASNGQHVADAPKTFGTFDKMLQLSDYCFDDVPVVAALGTRSLYLYRMHPD